MLGSNDTSLVAAARKHLWQPFSQPSDLDAADEPIVLTRGEGVWLWDDAGNRYLDGIGALESMAIGHGNHRLPQVAERQMRELAFIDVFRYVSRPAVELASKLSAIAPPGLTRVHFTPGGSEAVEVALKLAFQYHYLRGNPGKRRVICRQGAYHGVTFGAMNCDGRYWSTRTDIYLGTQRFGTVASGPATGTGWGKGARHTAGAEEIAAAIAETGPENVAAVIVDPVATASGVASPPPEDLAKLRRICDEHDILLIVDEVISGFGRTGRMFASEHADVTPDFMPISKALSSGYQPIGATLIADRVAEVFDSSGPQDGRFTHGHTFGGHPVACAVALENIRIIEEKDLVTRAGEMGAYLNDHLQPLRSFESVTDVRGPGLIKGIELLGERDDVGSFGTPAAACAWLRKELRSLGLITLFLHPGNVMLLAPPLIITRDEVDEMVRILGEGLQRLAGRLAA